MRKTSFLFGIFVIASLVLSACGGAASRRTANVVVIGWTGVPDSLNPGLATADESFRIFDLVYDTLYVLNRDGDYERDLADTATVSQDGRQWRIKMREPIVFHDGEPLTARDVAFSYNFYAAHPGQFPYMASLTDKFEKVTATPTTNEVIITLTEPIVDMQSRLRYLYVLPEHVWTGPIATQDSNLSFLRFLIPSGWATADAAAAMDYDNYEMIGSGPFKMVEYQPGVLLKLEAVKTHHQYQPQVDGLEIKMYSQPSELVRALQNGEVDILTSVPLAAVAALTDAPNVEITKRTPFAPRVSNIIINQIAPEDCQLEAGWACTGHPALRDRNVRLALAFALDKQRIVDNVMLGLATPGVTLVPAGLGGFHNDTVQDYGYDVDEANRLLESAGYLDTNDNGIRETPDGSRELDFRLEYPIDNPIAEQEVQLLKFMWAQIGVVIQANAADPTVIASHCCPAYDYDLILDDRAVDPDPGLMLGVGFSGNIPSGLNETGYSNPEYDDLYTRQAVESDLVGRHAMIWQLQQIAHADVVYIVPFQWDVVQAYRTDAFTGWQLEDTTLVLESPSALARLTPVPKQ
jgi:peptide/nickel transport system substrate-binding protein